ncbi:hypothetical protein [Klebsiella michiganensis]|uniref:hypothetical protein n=1 Tax=Klebsiella michiganensis TaxID=1134687 RepID=UPI002FF0CE4C
MILVLVFHGVFRTDIILRMKRTHDTLLPEQTVTALADFAWCALIALRIAQQEGQALSPFSMHFYCVG